VEKMADALMDSDVIKTKYLDIDKDQSDICAASSVGGKDNEFPNTIIL
jgi:hypothetical protein